MEMEEIKEWYIKTKNLYFCSIELTQHCNFNCKHCYCSSKNFKSLSLNDYKIIINKLAESGCLFLNLTGGEILAHKDFKEMYLYAKDKGFVISLLTNASLINEDYIKLFKEYPPQNIAVTIYGTSKEEYYKFTGNPNGYDMVMNSLRLLKENNIHFVLRTVATKTLYNSLMEDKFNLIAESFGTSFKYEPIIFPKLSGDKEPINECLDINSIVCLENNSKERALTWADLIASNKEYVWTCNAGVNSLAIDLLGNANVCGLYREEPISLVTNSLSDVLAHLSKIHSRHQHIVATNECASCKNRNICKWCPAYATLYNKNETEKIQFFCDLAEKRREKFSKG